ncbi:MAG: serine protease [Paracoccaceae bacterium]|nr:serine protease [Paracoccaceae bacterium]
MPQQYFNHHATRTAIQVFVRIEGVDQWTGTGFFVQVSRHLNEGPTIDCLLLISNKHVLAQGAGIQHIVLNKKGQDGQILFGDQELLELDNSIHRYTGHHDNEIDLACIDMRGIETTQYDVPVLSPGFLEELDANRIGVGTDVLFAGFPNGMKDVRNGLALMRKGSIASIPSMDCHAKGLLAVDGTVLPGNSGGPVFVECGNSCRLLGVIHARSTIADDFGFVIKQQYVNELIERALDKATNELRQTAYTIAREILEAGELGPEVQRIQNDVWMRIARNLDEIRRAEE